MEKLDHLVGLGIDVLELLPVAEFAGSRGWGYDGVAPFAPHHAYGGPDGLKGFVDACHGRGLGVVMDVVYNHVGPAGNYLAEFGPYFTERYRTNWGDAVNFDGPDSTEVRRFVVDNALMWLRDYHCDGLRLDAVHAIVDQSAVHILEEVGREVEAMSCHLQRPVFLIAESDLNEPRIVQSPRRRRVRPRRGVGRRMAPRPARHAHRGAQRLLRGLRAGASAGQSSSPGVGIRRGVVRAPAPGARSGPGRP